MALRRFHGIIPPLCTPLSGRDTLDEEGLVRLLERLIHGGVNGIFMLGTSGEAPSLSYRLRRDFITQVCRQVKGRVPVLVGITDTSFVESVNLAQHAADAGAAAVVLSTPYYFPAGQTELTAYVEHIVKELPLPLMLYNMPSLTKVWFDVETLQKLAPLDGIVGVKDSSGDLDYFGRLMSLRELRPDWSIMMGPEALLPQAMKLGGDGGVNGGANLFPKLFMDFYRAAAADDQQKLKPLNDIVTELQQIYEIGKYASRYIKATKCSLSVLGVCDDFMAEPFHRFNPPERERVKAIIDSVAARVANLG